MSESIGHGFLGKNDYKEKENQPDYKGKVTVESIDYDIAGWIREKKGRKYISLSFNPPYRKDEEKSVSEHSANIPFPPENQTEDNEDIPF